MLNGITYFNHSEWFKKITNNMKIQYIILFVVLFGSYSSAQHTQNNCCNNCSKWEFELSPGAWFTWMKGDITAVTLPGYINVGISDKFKGPDFSYFAELPTLI